MQSVRYEFLARTGLAVNQNCDMGPRQSPDGSEDFLHRRRFANHLIGWVFFLLGQALLTILAVGQINVKRVPNARPLIP